MADDVAVRMDSTAITRLHVIAGIVCACAFGADMMDITVGSALTAVFSQAPYQMNPQRLGWLISSVYIGAVIGGPIFGWFADRRGLKRIIIVALLWVGATSLLAAATNNVTLLLVFRLLSGLALGAIPPLVVAYLTGIAPTLHRGLYIFWVCAVSFLAAPVPIFLIRALTPVHPFGIEGWRWPFVAAGVLSLGSAAALFPLPESLRWLIKVKRRVEADAACARFERSPAIWGHADGARQESLERPTETSRLAAPYAHMNGPKAQFGFVAALFFLQPWSINGFSLLTGPILLARGYNLKDTLLFVGLGTFGPSISTLIVGTLIDRLQRSTAIVLSSLLLLIAAIVFFEFPAQIWMTAAVVVFGIGSGFLIPLMGTYASEIFISGAQGSAIATAWAINRVGAVVVPVALLPLLHRTGAGTVALCIYMALGFSIVLTGVLGPRMPKPSFPVPT
jgi:putative MFS transporter